MIAHDRNDDLVGQLEERFVEGPRHREWLFDERNALVGEEGVRLEKTAE